MAACFGAYYCFFAKEKLPAFYDQNKINFYSDGALRMNLPGVYFNNRNWPHILRACRTWTCVTMAAWTGAEARVPGMRKGAYVSGENRGPFWSSS